MTREQSRAATIRNLRGLRDTAVQFAKNALADGDWRTAHACLVRADMFENQADAMERGEVPPDPRTTALQSAVHDRVNG